MRFIFALYIILISFNAFSQRDSITMAQLQEARLLLNQEKYLEAQPIFKKILSAKKIIPNEVAYFYAINLYGLKKYGQSRSAFRKYTKITADTGQYKEETKKYLEKLDCQETGYKEVLITCEICYGDTILVDCHHCKGQGVEVCPTCRGNGVVSTQSSMGRTFHTCNRCNGEKIATCSVCKGKKKVRDVCKSCGGSGKLKVKRRCEEY